MVLERNGPKLASEMVRLDCDQTDLESWCEGPDAAGS